MIDWSSISTRLAKETHCRYCDRNDPRDKCPSDIEDVAREIATELAKAYSLGYLDGGGA